jgi:hypothetical protein
MNNLDHVTALVFGWFVAIIDILLLGLNAIERVVRTQLAHLGLAPPVQSFVLITLAVLFIVAALRLFGGILRALLIIFLLLVLLHLLVPVSHI